MTQNEKYQLMLKDQIRSAGKWLIDNSEQIVNDVVGISNYQIHINLKNGDEVPTITYEQENVFWDYLSFRKVVEEHEKYERLEDDS